jgi:hypothetical protein
LTDNKELTEDQRKMITDNANFMKRAFEAMFFAYPERADEVLAAYGGRNPENFDENGYHIYHDRRYAEFLKEPFIKKPDMI